MPSLRGAKGSFLVAAVQPERDLILTVPVAAGGLLVSRESSSSRSLDIGLDCSCRGG
jgi:hypothetical protein